MAPSPRQLVRNAVGLAAVAPAIGLMVLAIALMAGGGFSGFLAGAVVAGLAVLVLGAALVMTHAPVSIKGLLDRTDEARQERSQGGSNGHGRPERIEGELDERP